MRVRIDCESSVVLALTELLEEAVALVEHEVLELVELDVALGHEGLDAARGGNDDVGAVVREERDVLALGDAAVNDGRLDARKVLGEAVVLALDLVRELARVAHDEHGNLAVDGLQLVQRGEHEHGRLAHARLGLADHVHAQHGLRDALLLYLRGVLEAAVDHRAQQLGLEQEVLKGGRVDAHVVTPGDAQEKGDA